MTNNKTKKIVITIISVMLAIILLIFSAFFILKKVGKDAFHKNDKNINVSGIDGLEINEDVIEYNGKEYVRNEDVVSILFLGVDKEELSNNLGTGKNGQADTIFVAALNTKTKKINLIPIQRESMVDVDVYSSSGKYSGVNNEQICLSYAYGKDIKSSCENTMTSVSRLLFGLNVSNYMVMDLKGISKITDAIGGITLTSLEDIHLRSLSCKKGETVTLKGRNAQYYLQDRSSDITGSTKRLARQKQFLSVFASKAGNDIVGDFTLLKKYYDVMTPYISTDLSFAQVTYLTSSMITRDIGGLFEYKTIDGELKVGEKWVEYYPDKTSILNVIIDCFYKEK